MDENKFSAAAYEINELRRQLAAAKNTATELAWWKEIAKELAELVRGADPFEWSPRDKVWFCKFCDGEKNKHFASCEYAATLARYDAGEEG